MGSEAYAAVGGSSIEMSGEQRWVYVVGAPPTSNVLVLGERQETIELEHVAGHVYRAPLPVGVEVVVGVSDDEARTVLGDETRVVRESAGALAVTICVHCG